MRDLEHPDITRINRTGIASLVAQPEHVGTDYYSEEIVEGDQYCIDDEVLVLKSNLERYLSEVLGFEFKVAD